MPESPGIQVTVNGEAVRVPSGSTVADLLDTLKLDRGRVAVEHNLRVVARAEHASLRLNHGDRLEIVTFVGGGSGAGFEAFEPCVLTSPTWPPTR